MRTFAEDVPAAQDSGGDAQDSCSDAQDSDKPGRLGRGEDQRFGAQSFPIIAMLIEGSNYEK